MTGRLRLEVRSSKAGLGRLLREFSRFARRHGIPLHIEREMHLVLDEIVSNIITHGAGGRQPCHITVKLAARRTVLEVEVIDDAPPFNPLTEPEPRADLPLVERPIGGLGIYLVKQLMDDLAYARRDDRNHLVITRVIERV